MKYKIGTNIAFNLSVDKATVNIINLPITVNNKVKVGAVRINLSQMDVTFLF